MEERGRYEGIASCQEYLAEVVEAVADPNPLAVRRFLIARYEGFDSDIPEEPALDYEPSGGCGNEDNSGWDSAIDYLVSRRPEVVRQMLTEDRLKFRSSLLLRLTSLEGSQDLAIAIRFSGSANPALRASAVRALLSFKNSTAERLILRAASDPKREVRVAAASALPFLTSDASYPTLLRLLEDPCRTVAWTAHFSLTERTSPELAGAYARMLVRYPDRGWEVLQGLERNPIPEAVAPLIAHWRAKGSGWQAVPDVLAKINAPKSRAMVIAAIADPDPERRCAGIESVDQLPADIAEDAIVAALEDQDEEGPTGGV